MSTTLPFNFNTRPLIPHAHDYSHGESEPWYQHCCAQLLYSLSEVVSVHTQQGCWGIPPSRGVMRINANTHSFAAGKVATEILNLIGIHVGGVTSTVLDKLIIVGRSEKGCQTSATAWQISSANAGSIKQNISGEYWYVQWVPGVASQYWRICWLAATANLMISSLFCWNTVHRNKGAVAL